MKKALVLPFLVLLLSSCGEAKTNTKYGSNKFITEDGTCYILSQGKNLYFDFVVLKADGTGSAARRYEYEQLYGWEFKYIIDGNYIYLPFYSMETIRFEFKINESSGLREMSNMSVTYTEFTATY